MSQNVQSSMNNNWRQHTAIIMSIVHNPSLIINRQTLMVYKTFCIRALSVNKTPTTLIFCAISTITTAFRSCIHDPFFILTQIRIRPCSKKWLWRNPWELLECDFQQPINNVTPLTGTHTVYIKCSWQVGKQMVINLHISQIEQQINV